MGSLIEPIRTLDNGVPFSIKRNMKNEENSFINIAAINSKST